ncbi:MULTISPECIES: DUF305 domain-containing protein [unclassified Rhizobium]|uniref:DUF305 domain-containing protein n=1 Tax=unclassified Rhizobium TaxID=2613769 RepID=UPI00382A1B8E
MNILNRITTIAVTIVAFGPTAAYAQTVYPEKCRSADMQMSSGGMQMPGEMADYQKATMDGMKEMDANMMQGMMKKDADLSFICGMIAHHMGAISMSQVELKYGNNKWAKEKASKIIDDQTKEIKEMTGWLDKEAK